MKLPAAVEPQLGAGRRARRVERELDLPQPHRPDGEVERERRGQLAAAVERDAVLVGGRAEVELDAPLRRAERVLDEGVGVAGHDHERALLRRGLDLEAVLREVDGEREIADLEPRPRRVGQRERGRRSRRLGGRDRELHGRVRRARERELVVAGEADERVEAVARLHLHADLDRTVLRARLLLERHRTAKRRTAIRGRRSRRRAGTASASPSSSPALPLQC